MNSIRFFVCWLVGCGIGMGVLGRYSQGLSQGYGLALIALALLVLVPMGAAAAGAWLPASTRAVLGPCILVAATTAGCGRALLDHPPVSPAVISFYNGAVGSSPVAVAGTLAAEPLLSDRSQRLRVATNKIRKSGSADWVAVHGDLLITVPRYPALEVGEQVILSGTLTAPANIGNFDYAAYLARQGIYSSMSFPLVRVQGAGTSGPLARSIADARENTREALKQSIAEPEAALAIGVVTGDRTSMSKEVQDAFFRSGTVHVLAISGENIALIVGFVWLLYFKVGGRGRMPVWLAVIVLGFIALYTVFTGATPSVVRAAVMGLVLLIAPFVGRRYDPVAALAAAAFIMTAFNPALIFDAGFDLSFGSMLGIALLAPALHGLLTRIRVPWFVSVALATGLAAQSVTLPLSALIGGRVSLISPVATLLIDPALLPLMVSGIFTAIVYTVFPPLGVALGWLTWGSAAWMIWCARLCAALPWSSFDVGSIDIGWLGLYYGVFGLALYFLRRVKRAPPATRPATWAPGYWVLAAGVIGLWGGFIWVMLAR